MAGAIPGAELVLLKGVGRAVFVDEPRSLLRHRSGYFVVDSPVAEDREEGKYASALPDIITFSLAKPKKKVTKRKDWSG